MSGKVTTERAFALFDFDGTITVQDTFNDFLIWRFGALRFIWALLICLPLVVLYKLRVVPNDVPKRFFWNWFMKGKSWRSYKEECQEYSLHRIPRLLRRGAVATIRRHARQGDALVIVSASLSDWIRPWALREGFLDVIATEAEVRGGILTGRFAFRCCHGDEKVSRLRRAYPKIDQSLVYAYGDSPGDVPMLKLATHRFYRSFPPSPDRPDGNAVHGKDNAC